MAWTEKLPNGGLRAMWRDAGGSRRSASFDKQTRKRWPDTARGQKACMEYAIGREAVERDNGPQNTGKGLTWAQWSERWLELRQVAASTKRNDDHRIEAILKPKWGRVRLSRINHQDVQAWVNTLNETKLSASSIRQTVYLMSASMKAAVKAGHIRANPCALIDLPELPSGKERFLTKPEFWSVRKHLIVPPYGDAAVLLAYTGMRFGELAGLHWDRVDLQNNLIRIIETWDPVGAEMKPFPKSKRPRTVPIPEPVGAVLKLLPPAGTTCGYPHGKGSVCRSSLVLTSPTGLPLDYSAMRDPHWIDALDLAKIPRARLHDLRHTHASWLAQDGVSMQAIQKQLGHGSVKVTERYSHIGAEQYEPILGALSRPHAADAEPEAGAGGSPSAERGSEPPDHPATG